MKNAPKEVINSLKSSDLDKDILHLRGCEKIYEVKVAYLKKSDSSRAKDFTFEYENDKSFYMFITIVDNPNYLKLIARENGHGMARGSWQVPLGQPQGQLGWNFNFDYNKYNIMLNIAKKETPTSNLDIILSIPLNRENTAVCHGTKETIKYFIDSKNVKSTPHSSWDFEEFPNILEHYYIIEVETRKPLWDTVLKEDGIVSMLYVITRNKAEYVEIFTLIKYSLFFIKQSLINYISKYMFDIIYDFTHLPNPILFKFLSNLGVIIMNKDKQKIIFPLKQRIKSLKNLNFYNKIQHINKNMPNIKRGQSLSTVPIHKFIQLYNKYDQFYVEKEFKIKQSLMKKNKSYGFLKNSCVIDPKNDMITKEHKVDLRQTLIDLFQTFNEVLMDCVIKQQDMQSNKNMQRFLIENINKFIIQYTSSKGFFNIDIVMNEDSMLEFNCCKGKKLNKWMNNCAYKCLSRCLNLCNTIFEFNEGFFHKHFTILDYSYNFNEKNVIHTFLSLYDSSKKNNVRVFDIPFMEKWSIIVAGLILFVYKHHYGLTLFTELEREILSNELLCQMSSRKFYEMFEECVNLISTEFFELYEAGLPDYYLFCNRISKFPLDKYNCLDNLCQHFTNNSVQTLIRNSVIFFSPFDVVYNIKKNSPVWKGIYSMPNLNVILEPYLFLVDHNLRDYLDSKEKKELFLDRKKINLKTYLTLLKSINSEKVHYCLILGEDIEKGGINSIIELMGTDSQGDFQEEEIESLQREPVRSNYDFYFLRNLAFYFVYKLGLDVKEKMIDYGILKRYIDSLESTVTISFNDFDNTFLKGPPKNKNYCKKICKEIKGQIMHNMKLSQKIQAVAQNMTYNFYQYIKHTMEIINIQREEINSQMREKITTLPRQKCQFIKIGHYLVNYDAYTRDKHLDQFLDSQLFDSLFNFQFK